MRGFLYTNLDTRFTHASMQITFTHNLATIFDTNLIVFNALYLVLSYNLLNYKYILYDFFQTEPSIWKKSFSCAVPILIRVPLFLYSSFCYPVCENRVAVFTCVHKVKEHGKDEHRISPLNPLKGTSVPEKTKINCGLFMPQKSPLGDLGVNLVKEIRLPVIAKALPEANQITVKLVCFVVPSRNDEHKLCLAKVPFRRTQALLNQVPFRRTQALLNQVPFRRTQALLSQVPFRRTQALLNQSPL